MPLVMTTFKSLTNKYRSQVGEDEGLNKGNHNFYHVNEYGKRDAEWRESPTGNCTHRSKNENQCDKAQNDDMPCHHVGKKTDNQSKGLCEYTQEFNRQHDEDSHRCGNAGKPKDMSPEMLVGAEQDDKE